MPKITVSVPGPWWTHLSYLHNSAIPEGVRVKVPLGSGQRVGIVSTEEIADDVDIIKLKNIASVLDEKQPLPYDIAETIKWFAKTWFTGLGMAYKTLLPTKFLEGEFLPCLTESPLNLASKHKVKYIYEPRDTKRWEQYIDLISSNKGGVILLFPEALCAKEIWNLIPKTEKDGGILWPLSSPAKQWELWKEARAGNIKYIIGSQAASFVPLKNLSVIAVDDESSRAWRTQKHPLFHRRSLIAARAAFAGAELVLGGRMPSSKPFMQCNIAEGREKALDRRLIFVDMHDSSNFDIDAVKDSIPISRPLIRETIESRDNGKWAFWLLDRKGYAGEIFCDDCGSPVRCGICGGTMRWEGRKNRLACLSCKSVRDIPSKCPSCGGPFLEGVRPGLEALAEKASSLMSQKRGPVLLFQNDDEKIPTAKKLLSEYADGALVIGTRRTLALMDDIPSALVGWIDSDSEARSSEYDAKQRAFALIWESLWRGKVPDDRKIVIQSRRPCKNWQNSLRLGWHDFWEKELKERQEMELPPYVPMINITMPSGLGHELAQTLDSAAMEYWETEESADEIWVRTKKFDKLSSLIAPYFHIRNTRRGFPLITLSLD